jgi:hypothetical protein
MQTFFFCFILVNGNPCLATSVIKPESITTTAGHRVLLYSSQIQITYGKQSQQLNKVY